VRTPILTIDSSVTRHIVRHIAFALLAVCLAGCGFPFVSGSQRPIAYAPDRGQPTIVCLGDSLTAGNGAPSDQSYPAWLQKRLDSGGYHYRVINAGISGNRVADGLGRLDDDVLAYHPAIVIVALGSNDPGHTPEAQWESGLNTIVARLRSHGARVVLGGLNEPGMSEVYRRVASRQGTPLVWLTSGLWSRSGLWADAHHPDGAGYRVVMQTIWPTLVPLLRR
jgi:acyl-CoA thioesterase I